MGIVCCQMQSGNDMKGKSTFPSTTWERRDRKEHKGRI